jgi:excisionase family DNA binding protein
MNFDELPDIMTLAEVAKLLRTSKNTVYDEIHAGRLPVIKMGEKVFRFSKAAVLAYMEKAGLTNV